MNPLDPWYLENVVCPIDRTELHFDDQCLVSEYGRRYPVVDGLPVLLVSDEKQTIGLAHASIECAQRQSEGESCQLYVESLGISEQEKEELVRLSQDNTIALDPVVMMLIGATCGNAYKQLIGNRSLSQYPIPIISLNPSKQGSRLLDIGCSWGRWSIAAAKKGFSVVGIDPSLGAIMAARRITKELNLDVKYLVADGRFPRCRDQQFELVYSYSVLQHFAKGDVRRTLAEIGRVLVPGGIAKVQMATKWGFRSIQQQARRGFREPKDFEVRYWTISELKSTFAELIGETHVAADCYFGLGWQWSDFRYMTRKHRLVLIASEVLRRLSDVIPAMRMAADSVFCIAVR